MHYRLTKEASADLEKIWLYTAENWSVEQADRYLNLIFDEFEYLSLKPDSGSDFGKFRKGYLRSKVKSHIIFYKVNSRKNELEIIRILHEMMHFEKHFK